MMSEELDSPITKSPSEESQLNYGIEEVILRGFEFWKAVECDENIEEILTSGT